MATSDITYYCEGCKRTKRGDEFYTSNNLEKYPQDGKLNKCKDCITMFVDNWNPETFLWILQEIDVPYVPEEWDKLLQSYGKNREKCTGKTILGRYLSKMKLKQHKDYRWADTKYLQELSDHKVEQAMKRQGYGAAQIDQTLRERSFAIPEGELKEPENPALLLSGDYVPGTEVDYFAQVNGDNDDDITSDLTEEDKTYLRIKWGKSYKPIEWVQLEQLYKDMMESYDITSAGDINSLKMMCKASLKANQLLDIGDIDGAQKMTKVYDSLMKAGKWTAAQNKAEGNEIVDSVGELVAMCEADGFIERFYIDAPNDKIDKIILDNQKYVFELVNGDSGLNNLIENALHNIEDEKQAILQAGEDAEQDEDAKIFNYDAAIISDDDFVDFNEFKEQESLSDAAQEV